VWKLQRGQIIWRSGGLVYFFDNGTITTLRM
jgi:hypothetical protein